MLPSKVPCETELIRLLHRNTGKDDWIFQMAAIFWIGWKGVVWTSGILGAILLHLKVVYPKTSRILLQDSRISAASFSCSASSGSILEAVFCLNCFAKIHLFLKIVSLWIFLFRNTSCWLSHHKSTFLLVPVLLWHLPILAICKEDWKGNAQTLSTGVIDLTLTGK